MPYAVAITTYCLVAIIEHDLNLDRNIYEVIRILGSSLLTKGPIKEMFCTQVGDKYDDGLFQLEIEFR